MDDAHYMPTQSQLQFNNPDLLDCPVGTMAVCTASGGRVKKSFTACQCAH